MDAELAPSGPKYPDVVAQLSGADGNVFNLIAIVTKALRRAGVSREERDAFTEEVTDQPSYDAALRVMMRWVTVE